MKKEVVNFLEQTPWTHFITLEFPKVETAIGRQRFLSYDNENDHYESAKWLRKWRTRLDSALLSDRQCRKGRSADLKMFYVPEPTPGTRWLHYHLLAAVPRPHIHKFEKHAGDKWRKTLAANAFCFRQNNDAFSASRIPILYDCRPIYDRDGATGYTCKTLPDTIASHFGQVSFERFDFL